MGVLMMIFYLIAGMNLVEYRLWKNYGEIIYDYSQNNNLGTNGLSHLNTSLNTLPTDRGAYFPVNSLIRIPPNEMILTDVQVTVPYSLVFWVNALSSSGRLFLKWKSNYYVWIYRDLASGNICVNIVINGNLQTYCAGSNSWPSCNYYVVTWILLVLQVSSNTFIIKKNDSIYQTYSLSSNSYIETGSYPSHFIGTDRTDTPNLLCFVWYFLIIQSENVEISNYFENSSSGKCFAGSCSCSYSMRVPELGLTCVSSNSDITKDSEGTLCESGKTCWRSLSLICDCPSKSCEYENSLGCACIDYTSNKNYSASCKCSSTGGQGCCHSLCGSCTNESSCLTCKVPNSQVNQTNFCSCIEGYYADKPSSLSICSLCPIGCRSCLSLSECLSCQDSSSQVIRNGLCECRENYFKVENMIELICLPCKVECKTCLNESGCLTCKDLNSHVENESCSCNDFFFYDKEQSLCRPCLSECKECKSSISCLSCKDENAEISSNGRCRCKKRYFNDDKQTELKCQKCLDECWSCVYSTSCSECITENSIVNIDGLCECKKRFWNSTSLNQIESCLACPDLCDSCSDDKSCRNCSENSIFLNGKCNCIQGYVKKSGSCIINTFSVSFSVQSSYQILIEFDETLSESLKEQDLQISTDSQVISKSLIEQKLKRSYLITLTYIKVKKTSKVKVSFIKSPVISITTSSLNSSTFEFSVHFDDDFLIELKYQQQAKEAKSRAKTGLAAGIFLSLGVGVLTFDPSSFFNFLNIAEILYSVCLFDIKLNPISREFLLGLRYQSSIPNIFKYFLSEDGTELPDKFQRYGFKSHLFLLNIGSHFTALAVLIVFYVLVKTLGLITKLREKIAFVVNEFQFSVFIRFWLQSFFEVMVTGLIGYKFHETVSETLTIDFCFSIFFLVILMKIFEFTLVLILIFLIFKKNSIKDNQKLEKFGKMFKTIFNEFKEGRLNSLFYLNFVVRRLVLSISSCFIRLGLTHVIISSTISLLVITNKSFFYLIFSRCFKKSIDSLNQIFIESLISAFNICLLVLSIKGNMFESGKAAESMNYIIYSIWAIHMLFSIVKLGLAAHEKLSGYFKKRVDIQKKVSPERNVTTVEMTDYNPFKKRIR